MSKEDREWLHGSVYDRNFIGPTTRYEEVSKTETYYDMEDEKMTQGQLFKVLDEEDSYGKYLATDSAGKILLEMLNGGHKAYDRLEIEEVMPYTISIRFKTGEKEYSYQANKGTFEVGDLVVYEGPFDRTIAQVVAIDTKDKNATKKFVGWKLAADRVE